MLHWSRPNAPKVLCVVVLGGLAVRVVVGYHAGLPPGAQASLPAAHRNEEA